MMWCRRRARLFDNGRRNQQLRGIVHITSTACSNLARVLCRNDKLLAHPTTSISAVQHKYRIADATTDEEETWLLHA